MVDRYKQTLFTPAVLAAQAHYYRKCQRVEGAPDRDALTPEERDFIQARDSFYLATVSEDGWPYIQHRGGQPGFLRVLSPTRLAFADYKGNRQMISTGNLASDSRVSLFLMDYPHRERLKILGHARVDDARQYPELVAQLADADIRRAVERLFFIEVVSFEWNCSQYITPRYTAPEVEKVTAHLQQRIAELEDALRSRPELRQSP